MGVGCKGVGLGWVARDLGEVGKKHRGNYGRIYFNFKQLLAGLIPKHDT